MINRLEHCTVFFYHNHRALSVSVPNAPLASIRSSRALGDSKTTAELILTRANSNLISDQGVLSLAIRVLLPETPVHILLGHRTLRNQISEFICMLRAGNGPLDAYRLALSLHLGLFHVELLHCHTVLPHVSTTPPINYLTPPIPLQLLLLNRDFELSLTMLYLQSVQIRRHMLPLSQVCAGDGQRDRRHPAGSDGMSNGCRDIRANDLMVSCTTLIEKH